MQESLSFGPWLKQRRRVLNLTQQALAEQAACSLSTLRKIESGDLLPSKELAGLLAVAIGVPEAEWEAFIAFARDERRATLTPTLVTTSPSVPRPVPLPAALPPPPSPAVASPALPPPRRTLPNQLAPIIGRTTEVAEVQALLANPTCTMLTIIGPGGIGKTRLALAVAHALLENKAAPLYPDGIYFVTFVGITAPEFMVSTLATALGLSITGTADPERQLLDHLAGKTLLLVLDNLEHLLEGVTLLAAIAESTPTVKILTTSRERLALQNEWLFELPALAVPRADQPDLLAYPAVSLFVEAAQRLQREFTLSPQNGAAVVQICQLVGGMPLALELAASWVHALSCAEIAQEIQQSLDFLSVTRRDLPARQRSVRATFDYSWQLLSPAEQQVMRRLSVFRGGFQRDAAATVAGATLPLLADLVSKSLVRRTEEGRYDLHELVRQYAADHLHRDPEETHQTRHAHATHFLGRLDDVTGLFNHQHVEAWATLKRERENLRVAWRWTAESGRYALLRSAAPALWYFHDLSALLHEGATIFGQALQLVEEQASEGQASEGQGNDAEATEHIRQNVRSHLQMKDGYFQFRIGRYQEGRIALEASMTKLRQQQDEVGLADALLHLSSLAWFSGHFAQAILYAQECLAINERLGRRWWASFAQMALGFSTEWQGLHHEALAHFNASLALARAVGDSAMIATCLYSLSGPSWALGQLAITEQVLAEALTLATQIDDPRTVALVKARQGEFAYAHQEWAAAQSALAQAYAIFHERGDAWHSARCLNALGWNYSAEQVPQQAQRCFHQALQLANKTQLTAHRLDALVGLATLQATTQPHPFQVTVATYTLDHAACTAQTKAQAEALYAQLAAILSPEQLALANAQAQTTTLDALVATLARTLDNLSG